MNADRFLAEGFRRRLADVAIRPGPIGVYAAADWRIVPAWCRVPGSYCLLWTADAHAPVGLPGWFFHFLDRLKRMAKGIYR